MLGRCCYQTSSVQTQKSFQPRPRSSCQPRSTMNCVGCVSSLRRACAQTFRRPPLLLPPSSSSALLQFRPQSSEVVVAARVPYRVKVKAGKRYAWCSCGHSKKQPFCDGAHKAKAPSVAPLRFTPDKDRTVFLCACKQTKNAPYCDATHVKVIFKDVVNYVKGAFKK